MRIRKPRIMLVAMLLAVLIVMIPAAQAFAVSANAAEQNEPVYIKEIKMAEKTAESDDTENALTADGYTVIKDAEGYTTGIHAFKTTAAENLNNTRYVQDDKAPEIYIYYKTEDADAMGAKGSSLTMGYLAIAAAVGLLIGVGVAVICITATRKKKKESIEEEKTESEKQS